ncbi:MAG: hypothetical protein A3J79_11145 [Elusimicrobia bacterium RIFOXYB2_FULL_62_6]|nr:MAG: hypothetical protein A3J79_11145 [Elusimicrobia bacterium RIFOXYB2_FULL_62_6]
MTADHFGTAAALFEDFASAPLQSEDEIWEYLIRKAAAAVGCHAATIFEVDEAKKMLSFKKSLGPVGSELEGVSFGYQGIVGWCAENKRAILVNDTENDPRFTKKVDYGTGFKTKNIIAVPALFGGKLLAVVEFINSVNGKFTEEEAKLASMLTAFMSRDVYLRRLEATIKQLSLRGENTINNLTGGFIGVDLEGKVIFFNPKAKEIFAAGDEYLNQNIISFFHVSADIVAAIGDVLKEGKTVKRKEFKCTVNGAAKIIGYSSITIKGVDGKIIGAGVIFQDITNI